MARNEIVWGLDVGNTSLKALRCRAGSEPGTVEVLGFDYIEHSKVLSQPGADPTEILAESFSLFLSRNNVKGEKVAIAVSGQSALWRFQPLPPVDPRKVKDLVKYEVRQWLPFDLDEVIWSFRRVGGMQEGHILLDANIFMYAMKKELTYKTLASYAKNGIDVDCIQGAPIAIYNAYVNDLYDQEELATKDPTELTEFDILLNVGTDTTEVIITNGVVVWLRNIPIGGNLFTKSLTKSLKLTFSNAEHIKRNAATSQDPKAVILAMKPVFNEMLSEIDRSIKYYCSLNKRAKIRRIYALGNAMKLPGLRQFFAKSHGIDVVVPQTFPKLTGPEVLSHPQFVENASSFAVAYGLVLEMLGQAALDINLIPAEVVRRRLINAKKPWALAAAALLLLALTIQYVSSTVAFGSINNEAVASSFNAAKQVNDLSRKITGNVKKEVDGFKAMDKIGKNLTSNVEGRLVWLEFLNVLNSIIPAESLPAEVFSKPTREKAASIMRQDRVYVQNIEVIPVMNLGNWFNEIRSWYTIDDVEAEWFKPESTLPLSEAYFFPPAVDKNPVAAGKTTGFSGLGGGGLGGSLGGFGSLGGGGLGGAARPGGLGGGGLGGGGLGGLGGGGLGGAARPGGLGGGGLGGGGLGGLGGGGLGGAARPGGLGGSGLGGSGLGGSGLGGLATSGPAAPESQTAGVQGTEDPRLLEIPGPTGAGNVVQLTCYHYHNPDDINEPNRGPEYVRRQFLPRLKHSKVELPVSLEQQRDPNHPKTDVWSLQEYGIGYPVMINPGSIDDNYRLLDPEAAEEEYRKIREGTIKNRAGGGVTSGSAGGGVGRPSAGMGSSMGGGSMPGLDTIAGNMSRTDSDKILNLRRFDFIVQFAWRETLPTVREERRKSEANLAKDGTTPNSSATGLATSTTGGTAGGIATTPAASATAPTALPITGPTTGATTPALSTPATASENAPVEPLTPSVSGDTDDLGGMGETDDTGEIPAQ